MHPLGTERGYLRRVCCRGVHFRLRANLGLRAVGMSTATTSSAAAARFALRERATPRRRAPAPRRGPSRCRAVPQDDDRSARGASGADGGPGDRLASGLLGGASRDLADALDVSDDPDAVVEALGMRANLLDADDEARARQRAMDNLGSLMASGQAGALNAATRRAARASMVSHGRKKGGLRAKRERDFTAR